ncbi:Selenoprotein Pb, partial [Stegodyphus mimosarum]
MTDLQFIIVNHKASHAQELLHELQERVSFDVYQETEVEPVWDVMEGGKDDMYVYDRCGKLTYYVPFPLSVITDEQPIVATAVLATYFRSPCGINCEKNSSTAVEEFIKEFEHEENMTKLNEEVTGNESLNNTYNETDTQTESFNASKSNETIPVVEQIEYPENRKENGLLYEYYYPDYQEGNFTSESENSSDPSINKAQQFLRNLFNLFFNTDEATLSTTENAFNSSSFNSSQENFEIFERRNSTSDNTSYHHHRETSKKASKSFAEGDEKTKHRKKSARCAEANMQVCKNWSKNRLLHAQKCCSATIGDRKLLAYDRQTCKNFGKKRCKKIQTILKCCIKTTLINTNTTISNVTTVAETAVSSETASVTDSAPVTASATAVTSSADLVIAYDTSTVTSTSNTEGLSVTETSSVEIVCCKDVENNKFCRVSKTCNDDEYIDQSKTASM